MPQVLSMDKKLFEMYWTLPVTQLYQSKTDWILCTQMYLNNQKMVESYGSVVTSKLQFSSEMVGILNGKLYLIIRKIHRNEQKSHEIIRKMQVLVTTIALWTSSFQTRNTNKQNSQKHSCSNDTHTTNADNLFNLMDKFQCISWPGSDLDNKTTMIYLHLIPFTYSVTVRQHIHQHAHTHANSKRHRRRWKMRCI